MIRVYNILKYKVSYMYTIRKVYVHIYIKNYIVYIITTKLIIDQQ